VENQLITDIEQAVLSELDNHQMERLHEVLQHYLHNVASKDKTTSDSNNENLLVGFIAAKRVEGCSNKSLRYYESTMQNMLSSVGKEVKHITTDDLRQYLDKYQREGGAGKVTIDNIRRILSSFFSWLEDEDYILKSPVRRIHKVKTGKTVKETYSDEALELMRDHSGSSRDLAIIDLLISTGMRVGELVNLDRTDIDFDNRECVVFGKGDKERKVYFDARTKIHLQNYLKSRTDEDPALFVSMQEPHQRLKISGVEIRLRELGKKLNIPKVHPHKFRRTLATMAIDKGMPIEQVQQLLGHQSVDTTLQYAMVNQTNVKMYRVGGRSLVERPSSHTTVRTVPYTAVRVQL
jgi:site-specific recombinase XerD